MQGVKVTVNNRRPTVMLEGVARKVGNITGKQVGALRKKLGSTADHILGPGAMDPAMDDDSKNKSVLGKYPRPDPPNVTDSLGLGEFVIKYAGVPLPALPRPGTKPGDPACAPLIGFGANSSKQEVQCDAVDARVPLANLARFFAGTSVRVPGPSEFGTGGRSTSMNKNGQPYPPPTGFEQSTLISLAIVHGLVVGMYFSSEAVRERFMSIWPGIASEVITSLGRRPTPEFQEKYPAALVYAAVEVNGAKLAAALGQTIATVGLDDSDMCFVVRGHGMEMPIVHFIEHVEQFCGMYNENGTGSSRDYTFVIPTDGVLVLCSDPNDEVGNVATFGLGGYEPGTVRISHRSVAGCPATIKVYDENSHILALSKRTRRGQPQPMLSFAGNAAYQCERWFDRAKRGQAQAELFTRSSVRIEVSISDYDSFRAAPGADPIARSFAAQVEGGGLGVLLQMVPREAWLATTGRLLASVEGSSGAYRGTDHTRGKNDRALPNPVDQLVANGLVNQWLTTEQVTGAGQLKIDREALTPEEIAARAVESSTTAASIEQALRDLPEEAPGILVFIIKQLKLVKQRGAHKGFRPDRVDGSATFSKQSGTNRSVVAGKVAAWLANQFADDMGRAGSHDELKALFTRNFVRLDGVQPEGSSSGSDGSDDDTCSCLIFPACWGVSAGGGEIGRAHV